MTNYYTHKPGLGETGEYEASGKPFFKGKVDCKPGPVQIVFPSVTSWIVFQNHDVTQADYLHVAISENGLPSNGGTNYFTIHDNSTYSYWSVPALRWKVTSVWIEGSDNVDIVAGLTGVDVSEIPNNWSGSSGVG